MGALSKYRMATTTSGYVAPGITRARQFAMTYAGYKTAIGLGIEVLHCGIPIPP